MKKFNIKKTISASLVALALCPAIAAVKPNVDTYAAGAFIADTDYNGAYNVDESQIKVDAVRYYPAGTAVSVKTSGNVVSTAEENKCPVLARRIFTIGVDGSSFTTANVNMLKNMTLSVTYKVQGKTNTQTYKNPEVRKVNNKRYEVSFSAITLGDAYTFKTSAITGISGFSCTYAANAPASGSGDYYMVTADTPNGENIVCSIKNNGKIKYEYLSNWAKRVCVYANALSKTTGVKLGTLYICFDYDTEGSYAYSWNYHINPSMDKLGFVAYSADATAYELDRMAKGNNEFTWCTMHEIAHSYGVQCNPRTFENNFSFGDDYLCNARGLTAIQNCDNLRNTKIYHDDAANATYDQIFNKVKISATDDYYGFGNRIANIGNKYGWDKLETYFAATSDYSYSSAENKEAAKALNEFLGKNYSYSANYLKFVNNLRKLYKLSWNQSFNYYAFKSFAESEIGKDLILLIAKNRNF